MRTTKKRTSQTRNVDQAITSAGRVLQFPCFDNDVKNSEIGHGVGLRDGVGRRQGGRDYRGILVARDVSFK